MGLPPPSVSSNADPNTPMQGFGMAPPFVGARSRYRMLNGFGGVSLGMPPQQQAEYNCRLAACAASGGADQGDSCAVAAPATGGGGTGPAAVAPTFYESHKTEILVGAAVLVAAGAFFALRK
jgi:hypothetical protein